MQKQKPCHCTSQWIAWQDILPCLTHWTLHPPGLQHIRGVGTSGVGGGILETRGGVRIRSLWEIQTVSIIRVRFVDSDAYTYKHEPMYNLLDHWENQNKDKHSNHFHDLQKNIFSICRLSVWHDQGGGSSRTREFESTHGLKTWRTHFTHMWLGWQAGPKRPR